MQLLGKHQIVSLENLKADIRLVELAKNRTSVKPQEFKGVTSVASSPKK